MTIAIIGAGNMGEAVLAGLCRKHDCVVCESRGDRRKYLSRKYRVKCVASIPDAVSRCQVVLLAVKPQDLPGVLQEIRPLARKQLFVSIAAGITAGFIESALGGKARVIRTMPNLPAMIGQGITAVSAGKHAAPADVKKAVKLLKSVGEVLVLPEKMINAVTAVSGSGPAYVFLVAESMILAARELGFDETQAKRLVYQTMLGSVQMMLGSPDSAQALRLRVTSKGGTTQAATDVFMERDLTGIFVAAVKAASHRARELAK